MNCPQTTLLARFVDGLLSPSEVAGMVEHLDGCETCFAKVSAQAALAATEATAVSNEPSNPALLRELVEAIGALGYDSRAPPRKVDDPIAPSKIGRYEIEGTVGQGAMGVVYRARDPETGRPLAIKTATGAKSPAMSSIRQEIAFLRHSRHRGVVEIFDYDLVGRQPWYAMELLEGETLADRNIAIWRDTPRDWDVAPSDGLPDAAGGRLGEMLTFYRRLCEPLSFVHRAGVVHCDLKPANVFIRDGEQPVLMDFGLVHDVRGMAGREALVVGSRRGTAYYMSPEVIAGQLPDPRADLYALGCMLYESLTGRPPFLARTQGELLEAHTKCKPAPPSSLVNRVPATLDALVESLLAKRPQDRVGHVDEIAEVLGNLTEERAPRAPSNRPARAAYLFRPRLIGRERQVTEIASRCEQAIAGKGGIVFIAGESGIGKTFLASEVSQRALLKGMRVLTGECIPVGADHLDSVELSGAPLHPFRKLLEAVGDRFLELGQEAHPALAPKLRLLAAYEPRLRALSEEGEQEALPPLPGPAARERLMEALTEVLAVMAENRPLLLTIDDLQWADDISAAFLDSLQEDFFERARLVILGTYRTDEAGETVRRIAAKPWVSKLTLGRLDSNEVQNVAGEMLAMPDPPQHLVEFLNAHSEGVPFFVAEYLRAVTAEGLLAREQGKWRLNGGSGASLSLVSFPTNLAGLVERRVSALPSDARFVVEAAAVLGREFERPILARLSGIATDTLGDSLQQMALRQIVEEVRPETYRFLHDAIRELVYAKLDTAARGALHGSAADAMLCCYEETREIDQHYAEIAHHLLRAERFEQAVGFLEKAGERALAMSADKDAARYFREALEVEQKLEHRLPAIRRARWERQTADAEQGLGRMKESAEPLARAAALLGRPLPASKRRTGAMLLPLAMRQLLHRVWPGRFLGSRVRDSEALMEAGRVFDRLQRVYYYLGEDVPLLFANLSTLNLSELALPSAELAMAYANAAAVAGILPAHRLAEKYFALAIATQKKTPDPAVASYIEMLAAVHLAGVGRTAESAQRAENAIALAEGVGFFRRRDESLAVRGQLELTAGRLSRSSPWLEMLDTSAKRRGDVHMKCWAALLRAQRAILAGDVMEAAQVIESVAPTLGEIGRPEKIWAAGLEAYAAYRRGDVHVAVDAADRAANLIAQGPPAHVYCFDAYARVAEVRLELWNARSAVRPESRLARDARDACGVLLRAARIFPLAVPAAMLHEGARCWAGGHRRGARRLWLRGQAAAREMALPYYEARLDLALASTLSNGRDQSALTESGIGKLQEWKVVDGATFSQPNRCRN